VDTVDYYEQKRELVEIKEVCPEYQEIASHVLQDVILRVKKAYNGFFRRVKKGETPGYPRFVGSTRYRSFTTPMARDGNWTRTDDQKAKKAWCEST